MKYVNKAKEYLEYVNGIPNLSKFELEYVIEAAELFYARHPLVVGTRAVLIKTPEITDTISPGWRGSKHFLKKGAKGTVEEVYLYKGVVRVGIVFDKQTWIDNYGVEHPVTRPAMFVFSEHDLVAI